MVIREDGGGRRRSSRASTVDDGKLKTAGINQRKRKRRTTSTDSPDNDTNCVEDNLLQVEGSGKKSFHPANDDTSLAPTKRVLELILDTLQRRDAYELFAEPVDPTKVEDYYEIIKDPMDFGTMRAKLHEDMYQFLHQFEHDVLLIFKNAMQFNTCTSTYFKQARALDEMAKRVFHTLKTDPEKFELEFGTTKRRSARKICSDDRDANLGSSSKPPRDNKRAYGKSTYVDSIVARDGRASYKPLKSFLNVKEAEDAVLRTMYVESTPLLQVSQQEIGYRESLMAFVNDLGPAAKRVAQRKVKGSEDSNLSDVAIISCNSNNSQDEGKRSKISNKQIVLAVPAAPGARGRSCANSTQPTNRRTKAGVKGRRYDPERNDSSPRKSKDVVEDEARKTKAEANKEGGQPMEVKGAMEAPSWELNRLDLNVDPSLSGRTTMHNHWRRSGDKVNMINNGARGGWSQLQFHQYEGRQASAGLSASSNITKTGSGREFHLNISYLRSRLNGVSPIISPPVGVDVVQSQPNNMQMQIRMLNSMQMQRWPCLPNSKFGA